MLIDMAAAHFKRRVIGDHIVFNTTENSAPSVSHQAKK
jgi:hypothetical protein